MHTHLYFSIEVWISVMFFKIYVVIHISFAIYGLFLSIEYDIKFGAIFEFSAITPICLLMIMKNKEIQLQTHHKCY